MVVLQSRVVYGSQILLTSPLEKPHHHRHELGVSERAIQKTLICRTWVCLFVLIMEVGKASIGIECTFICMVQY